MKTYDLFEEQVATVDGFQGQEAEIIIIAMVQSQRRMKSTDFTDDPISWTI